MSKSQDGSRAQTCTFVLALMPIYSINLFRWFLCREACDYMLPEQHYGISPPPC